MFDENIRGRSLEFYQADVSNHRNVDEFVSADLKDGVHSVWGERFPIDFYLSAEKGRPLLIFFNGLISRTSYPTVPVFHGIRVMSGLGASFVSFSDPSLYADESLSIGWYAGATGMPLQQILRPIIDKIAHATQASRLIFCGPSGGGFAAMAMAVHYPQSLTYVWNPQTDIRKYEKTIVGKYANLCFGLTSETDIYNNLPKLTGASLVHLYSKYYRGNTVLYTQNLSDGHVKKHAEPFLRSITGKIRSLPQASVNRHVAGGIWYFSCNWGQGHVAPSGFLIRKTLEAMIRNAAIWPKLTRSGGVGPIIGKVFEGTLAAAAAANAERRPLLAEAGQPAE